MIRALRLRGVLVVLAFLTLLGALASDGRGQDDPSTGSTSSSSGAVPSIEEMREKSLERRASAEQRVAGDLAEIFLTLENNPPQSASAVAARERLVGEAFTIALPRLVENLEKPNANLARSSAIRLRDAAAANAGTLPRRVVAKIVAILEAGTSRAKTEALVVARAMRPSDIGATVRKLAMAGDIRKEAIDILKSWHDPEGIPAFRAALEVKDDESLRRAGIDALVAMGDRASLPLIEPLVSDPGEDVRKSAFAAIGALGDETVLPALYAQLALVLQDPGLRSGTGDAPKMASAILSAIGALGQPSSLGELRKAAPSCPEPIQADIRGACGRILTSILNQKRTDALEHVRPFIDEANPALRDLALEIVGALGDKESIPILLKKIDNSQDPKLLKKLAETLGTLGEKSAEVLRRLRKLLKHDSWDVRVAAALALGRMREYSGVDEVLIKPFEEQLKDDRNDASARLAMARNYKAILKYKSAISEYREALKMPRVVEGDIYLEIAACYALDGKIEEGKRELAKAKSRGADVEKALAERADLANLR